MGIDAGLGRGGIPAGLGRGGMPAGLGRGIPAGEGRAPAAGVIPNGLLPAPRAGGRAGVPGVPGRAGAAPGAGVAGRGLAAGEPGRGPIAPGPGRVGPVGVGESVGPSASRCLAACWAALTAASCSFFRAAARASAAATSMSWALLPAGAATGGGVGVATGPGTGAFGRADAGVAADFFGGIGIGLGPGVAALGAATSAGAPAGAAGVAGAAGAAGVAAAAGASKFALNRRATGASTVLEADLTNSPISLSLARTVLLSTPSSLASSCTRALPATALLTSRPCGQPASTSLLHLKPDHWCDFIVCSCRSSCFVDLSGATKVTTVTGSPRGVDRAEVLHQRTGVDDTGHAQRSPEGATPLRKREASRIEMQMRTAPRQSTPRIRLEF